jgi:hypothetical protein
MKEVRLVVVVKCSVFTPPFIGFEMSDEEVADRAAMVGELTARPSASPWRSFFHGVGSVLDMFTPPAWPVGEKSDGEKLQEDWNRIAIDSWRARAALKGTSANGPCVAELGNAQHIDNRGEIDCGKGIDYDLGEKAVLNWVKYHWSGYLRARWLEHMQGTRFWIELPREDFGILDGRFQDNLPLLNQIVERLKSGQGNLDIIWWALDANCPMDVVIAILEAIDINSKRLDYRFT